MTQTYSTPTVMEKSAAQIRQSQWNALTVLNNHFLEWKKIPEMTHTVVLVYEQLFNESKNNAICETHYVNYFHLKSRLQLMSELWLFQRAITDLAVINKDDSTVRMIATTRKKMWGFSDARLGLFCYKMEQAIEVYESMLLLTGFSEISIENMKSLLGQLDGTGRQFNMTPASAEQDFYTSPIVFNDLLLPLIQALLPQISIVQDLVLAAKVGNAPHRDQKSDERAA